MEQLDALQKIVAQQPYPHLFATVSGAHLHGFASADSDVDLRGVHTLPTEVIVGLYPAEETLDISRDEDGLDLDLVTHDIKKFFTLMLRNNGHVLGQLFSPLIVHSGPAHETLLELSKHCVTRFHAQHYLGFARNQWSLFLKDDPHRIKPLLYTFRVLMTGIHLIKSGKIEANLKILNADFQFAFLDELIAQKSGGHEKETLKTGDLTYFKQEYGRLTSTLEEARKKSTLPAKASCKRALHNLLLRVRLSDY